MSNYNMVNFGPLAAEIGSLVWGTPANFNGFRVLAALLHVQLTLFMANKFDLIRFDSSGRQPHFAVLNRGLRLCSTGRASRWALAQISSLLLVLTLLSISQIGFTRFVTLYSIVAADR